MNNNISVSKNPARKQKTPNDKDDEGLVNWFLIRKEKRKPVTVPSMSKWINPITK